jgi:thermitase
MEILHNLAWILTSSFLILWTVFSGYKSTAKIFKQLFFIGAPILLISIFLSKLSISGSLYLLGKDLVVMALIAVLFSKFKANKIVAAGLFVAFIIGSFQWLKWDNNKSSINLENIELSDDFELLVLHDEDYNTKAFNALTSSLNLSVENAFNPSDFEETDLDEYWAIGIPDDKEGDVEDIIILLNEIEGIEWIEPNEVMRSSPIQSDRKKNSDYQMLVNDPMVAEQWGMSLIKMNEFYQFLLDEQIVPQRKARLAIVDSGVDAQHEDLNSRYISTAAKHDIDSNGHGTHCAGIASAATNNGKGIASYDPTGNFVEITGVKAMNDLGLGNQRTVSKAIIEAIDAGADVISLSLGGRSNQKKEKAFNSVVEYANKHNVILIVAAGNSNRSAKLHTPANLEGVITVAAVTDKNERASFSNTVNEVDMGIAAPGKDILSTFPNNKYKVLSGTSMATPFVSGLVAVMRSLDTSLDTKRAFEILRKTGISTNETNLTGKCIQADEAIKMLYNQQAVAQ